MEILNYIDLSDQKIEKVKEKRHFDKTLFSHVSARITAIPIDTIIDDIFIYLGKNIRVLATVMLVLATLSLVFNAVRLFIESRIVITLPTKSIETNFLQKTMEGFAIGSFEEDFDADGKILDTFPVESPVISQISYETYTVKPGESILSISKKFGLSNISTLIAINDISNVRLLQAGQKLSIPSIDGLIHVVKSNESISQIAQKYGLNIETLLDVNDLSSATLLAGQKLFIPGATLSREQLQDTLGDTFKFPLRGTLRMTSAYGSREDPIKHIKSYHTGVDWGAPKGTPVFASLHGKVAHTGFNNIFGKYVIISHAKGYQTLYAHLNSYCVKIGQSVNQGDKIGAVGSTGYSTGPHLHFTIYKNGKHTNPMALLKR